MPDPIEPLSITFRCPPELDPILPKPIPAVRGLPDWFKDMPHSVTNAAFGSEQFTVKKCPPFIDAMTCGFLMPLVADLRIEDGAVAWDRNVPGGALANYSRSPIDFHESDQVIGSPFFEPDRFIIKFNNFWTIELPPGYSLLITHPLNRADLPFTTLTGMVDADLYRDNFINFPAQWRDHEFEGVLPMGTPVAQCIPIKRERWTESFDTITGAATERLRAVTAAFNREAGIYRHQFRAPKR
jgi:hypothetical protein